VTEKRTRAEIDQFVEFVAQHTTRGATYAK